MERPSRELTNIRIAQIIAERGTCARLKVGAVITEDNRIISTGYNGPAKDEPHCSCEICNQSEGCVRAVHAEANAIINAGIKDEFLVAQRLQPTIEGERIIYCTTQPCLDCAADIRFARITTVYFVEPYRNTDGLEFLLRHQIKVYQIDNEGNTKQIKDL